jgi:hypothetical protein
VNRRSFLLAAPAVAVPILLPDVIHAASAQGRAPRLDEVDLHVFQYATGDHPLPIGWASNPSSGHVHTAPVYDLNLAELPEPNRPFQFRIEPRWRGGRTDLDVIYEVKIYDDIDPVNPDSLDGKGFSSQWSSLVHLGPQARNREMAQIGQEVTMGRGLLLHPMPGRPILYHFVVDFQLGSQSGPKLTAEARVLVSR